MKQETFIDFWNRSCEKWYAAETVNNVPVANLCKIKSNYGIVLYERYEIIKKNIKGSYFKHKKEKLFLNRYKRAAVIAYTIIGASPLEYKDGEIQYDLDPSFLKQRLAFYIALSSIIQDYSEEEVAKLEKPIFYFQELGQEGEEVDSFLESVYKDLFFAEKYCNYNVLTMANVFGLLIERASKLSSLKPVQDTEE